MKLLGAFITLAGFFMLLIGVICEKKNITFPLEEYMRPMGVTYFAFGVYTMLTN